MQKILVLATGGSIAGTAGDQGETVRYVSAQRGVDELLSGLAVPVGLKMEARQLVQVDSKDMSFAIWRQLALSIAQALKHPDVKGIVITHGTDTLEETAYFLHHVLQAHKPVVLTAAMRPATALGADGPVNLVDAMTLAGIDGAHGVMCVMNGRIFGAEDIRKSHTYRLDAFAAGEAGALGALEAGQVRQWRAWPEATHKAVQPEDLPEDEGQWPWVEVVFSCVGTTGAAVDALVKQGVRGIVVAATGNGTVHEGLLPSLKKAQQQGVLVVRAARVGDGVILGDDPDGIARAANVSPVKARVQLILELLSRH